jgi:predicted transcriptional regulator
MPTKSNNFSVKLSDEEVKLVEQMAKEWQATRHGVLHLAIQKLIADWRKGFKPKQEKKTVSKLKL